MAAVARDQLKSFVERVERLESEKAELASDIRDVYKEAKANGFDVPALRTAIKLRKMDKDEREARFVLLGIYMEALGMLSDTPLGESALKRDLGFAEARA